MRAVIVRHEDHEGEGRFGPALSRHGFSIERRFRTVLSGDADADLVVVMGGPMSACTLPAHPFLARELALIVDRLQRDRPCLGVCLGAQLLARAAGARVVRGANGPEIGALPVEWTAAAGSDPAIGAAPGAPVVAQWHEDTFTPVPGAVLLASSSRYEQQAFRLGASYGFQFHIELDAAAFARWLDAGRAELTASGADVDALMGAVPRLAASDAAHERLVDRIAACFAAAVRCTPH
ncbi:MAG: type 1 glutamine amidotransferase [Planctomycetes bacterium]|nr:type 1 glutamine amidotransferase [Planctomycetota bacterium]